MSIHVQRSAEWHEMRRKFIGASDASTIMGINPYKTIYQLWLEKLGLIEPEPTNAACQRGIDLEPIALDKFNKVYGLEFIPKVVFHPTINYMMASLDGVSVLNTSIVEIKCNGKKNHKIASKGQIPAEHWPQLQHQLEVTECHFGYYYSFDGEDGEIISFERDQSYIDILLEKEAEFWYYVTNFIAPPITAKDHRLQLKKEEVEVIDDPEWEVAIDIYHRHKKQVELSQSFVDSSRETLIKLANGKNCRGAGYKVSKTVKRGAISYADIRELQGVDLELYRKSDVEYWRIELDGT